jgi:hypothetical protein
VNTLVRWNVFQWDVRIAVVSLVVAVVSLGALGFVVLRKTGVSEVEPRKWVFVADAKPFEWVDDAAN